MSTTVREGGAGRRWSGLCMGTGVGAGMGAAHRCTGARSLRIDARKKRSAGAHKGVALWRKAALNETRPGGQRVEKKQIIHCKVSSACTGNAQSKAANISHHTTRVHACAYSELAPSCLNAAPHPVAAALALLLLLLQRILLLRLTITWCLRLRPSETRKLECTPCHAAEGRTQHLALSGGGSWSAGCRETHHRCTCPS